MLAASPEAAGALSRSPRRICQSRHIAMSQGLEMYASATFRLEDGTRITLFPGDVIGRMRGAALRVNDPRVSEAHALLSLRGTQLRLLALRGRFGGRGERATELALEPGVVVELAPGLCLAVAAVTLPESVLAIETPLLGRVVPPRVASLMAGPLTLVPGFVPEAAAVLWSDDELLHLRRASEPDLALAAGDVFGVDGQEIAVVAVPLASASADTTAVNTGFNAPLVLVLNYDTVHVWRGPDTVAIDGIPARILSELALIRAPASWRTVAHEIWPQESDDGRLRMNWDGGLARLRRRFREARIRSDLVRTDGAGLVELFLGPDDRIDDRA